MYEQLKAIMVSKFQLDPAEVSPEATLKDLELDSLDVVELSLVVEKEMGVSVSDDELIEAVDVAAVVALIEARSVRV